MNNVFDLKRFGNYFLYDLRRARVNYGLSLLILGLMPAIVFLFYVLASLIFNRTVTGMDHAVQFMSFFIATVAVIMSAGARIYGNLTDRRAGSDWLLIPVSRFEKWLSMVLIVCVVIPVILFVLIFSSDALMATLLPNTYGESLVSQLNVAVKGIMDEESITVNLPAILWLNWCESILVFTVGAVCFKKSKVAKTLLCIIAFSFLISSLLILFTGDTHITIDFHNGPDDTERMFNWFLNICYTVIIGGLLGGLYYRIRTLKH